MCLDFGNTHVHQHPKRLPVQALLPPARGLEVGGVQVGKAGDVDVEHREHGEDPQKVRHPRAFAHAGVHAEKAEDGQAARRELRAEVAHGREVPQVARGGDEPARHFERAGDEQLPQVHERRERAPGVSTIHLGQVGVGPAGVRPDAGQLTPHEAVEENQNARGEVPVQSLGAGGGDGLKQDGAGDERSCAEHVERVQRACLPKRPLWEKNAVVSVV